MAPVDAVSEAWRQGSGEAPPFLSFFTRASGPVILSPAGAKDLLVSAGSACERWICLFAPLARRILGPRCPEPGARQVLPCGVLLFDQAHLACTHAAFELLLAGDGVANIAKLLEVNQPRDVVPAREAGGETELVLIHASREVVGDARVQHSRATRHDVHVVSVHPPPKWRLGRSRSLSILGGPAPNPAWEGSLSSFPLFRQASAPVILSPAGAKDLLCRAAGANGLLFEA